MSDEEVKPEVVSDPLPVEPVAEATEPIAEPEPQSEEVNNVASMPRFRVTYGGLSMEIDAIDELAARAFFNDRQRVWPMPREVTVERLN